jgi:hypothetical protein
MNLRVKIVVRIVILSVLTTTIFACKKEIDQLEVSEFMQKPVYKIVAKQSAANLQDLPFDLR